MNPFRRMLIRASALSVFLPIKSFAQNNLFKLPFYIEIEVSKKHNSSFRKSEASAIDINKLNEQYIHQGKILSIDVKENIDSVSYRYKFANYEIYREWNDKVYHQNQPLKQSLASNGTKYKKFF